MTKGNPLGLGLLANDNNRHITKITHDFVIDKNWQGVKLKFINLEKE